VDDSPALSTGPKLASAPNSYPLSISLLESGASDGPISLTTLPFTLPFISICFQVPETAQRLISAAVSCRWCESTEIHCDAGLCKKCCQNTSCWIDHTYTSSEDEATQPRTDVDQDDRDDDAPESEPAAADDDAAPIAIGDPVDDGAAPFAIDVPAYRRELERRERDTDALAVVAAADACTRAGL
jgi:hypothetical protein